MKAPRRGRPPKAPEDVRAMRVEVRLTEAEHATYAAALGGEMGEIARAAWKRATARRAGDGRL